MITDARLEQALRSYERSIFGGDSTGLAHAERALDALEADAAVARGRLLHARFLNQREKGDSVEDPAELTLFQRAAELYQRIGDMAGEADARFWIGCLYQVVRSDDDAARPELERSRVLAEQAGARLTLSYALRHLAFMAHQAGDLDTARARFARRRTRPRWYAMSLRPVPRWKQIFPAELGGIRHAPEWGRFDETAGERDRRSRKGVTHG